MKREAPLVKDNLRPMARLSTRALGRPDMRIHQNRINMSWMDLRAGLHAFLSKWYT